MASWCGFESAASTACNHVTRVTPRVSARARAIRVIWHVLMWSRQLGRRCTSRTIAEGLFIRINGFDEGREQPAKKHTRQVQPSRGDFYGDGTVRQHLRRVHLSPLPLRYRLQPVNTRDYLVDGLLLKQILHYFINLSRESGTVEFLRPAAIGFALAPAAWHNRAIEEPAPRAIHFESLRL